MRDIVRVGGSLRQTQHAEAFEQKFHIRRSCWVKYRRVYWPTLAKRLMQERHALSSSKSDPNYNPNNVDRVLNVLQGNTPAGLPRTEKRHRTMIDSSRKYVVPLVEYLDRSGFTKRVGDQRVLADG